MNIPEKMWIEKLLTEKDKAYHIWGKFFENDELSDLWIPKAAIIKDNKIEIAEVDYSKYSHRPPLEHQKTAIEALLKNKKFILADDMGLGKTTSTIIASLETGAKKILIICPASLKINWQREYQLYSDKSSYVCEGKNYSEDAEIVVMNYDIIKNFHDAKDHNNSMMFKSKFDLVIIDEAHYIQNVQAQRTKLINDLVKNVDRLWLLTGTPMTSRPINYFNLLSLVDSPVAKNWMAYVVRYCAGYQFRVGPRKVWNVMGASNLEELRDRTGATILRRLKDDVLDLPEKIITPVYLRLRSKNYEELMGEYYNWYEKNPEESKNLSIQFTKLTQVRQLIADEKTQHTIELAENIIEQGKKVIIFCNFTHSLEIIYNHFGKAAVRLDGSMSKTQRQDAVDRFQEDEKVKVFVGNIKASGTGITLTAGEAVIMNDLSFLPSDMAQAEDRAYRYGQKNNVLVYYPLYENTLEMIIYDIVNSKKKIISTVMGDVNNATDAAEEILKRIYEMKK
jgi:SWI/SNF-related matrix-associated actin-dependent regulator 1 of chromatin subfamily A